MPTGTFRIADITGGGQALGQGMALAVEAARIRQSPWCPHAHLQVPSRPGLQLRARARPGGLVIVIPRQLQQLATQRPWLAGVVIHPETEAGAPRFGLRQIDDAAFDGKILLFQGRWQLRRQHQCGLQTRPGKANQPCPQPTQPGGTPPQRNSHHQQQQQYRPRR